jgi:hypothetical protein
MELDIVKKIKDIVINKLDDNANLQFNFDIINFKKYERFIFIDGGNNNIFSTPFFNLDLIKISAIFFENGEKTKTIVKECYLLTEEKNINKKIKIETTIFNVSNNSTWYEPKFEINENKYHENKYNEKIEISNAAEFFRRMNELFIIDELSKIYQNDKNFTIVLDGSIYEQFKEYNEEKIFLDKLKNEKQIIGFVKTNKERDLNLYKKLINLAPKNEIWFSNLITNEKEFYYVKLHKNSKYIFKIEINKKINFENIKNIIEGLAENSRDCVFQGYPYGLILADKLARVSLNETNYKKTKLLTLINKDYSIEEYLNLLNSHDKIDSINYSK